MAILFQDLEVEFQIERSAGSKETILRLATISFGRCRTISNSPFTNKYQISTEYQTQILTDYRPMLSTRP